MRERVSLKKRFFDTRHHLCGLIGFLGRKNRYLPFRRTNGNGAIIHKGLDHQQQYGRLSFHDAAQMSIHSHCMRFAIFKALRPELSEGLRMNRRNEPRIQSRNSSRIRPIQHGCDLRLKNAIVAASGIETGGYGEVTSEKDGSQFANH